MLAKQKIKNTFRDIAYYATDSRLTAEPDGKRYRWREMIEAAKRKGSPLSNEEAEKFHIP